MRQLEDEVLRELREVTKLPKLRPMDIAEWSTGEVKPREGELIAFLPNLKITVAYKPKNKA
jgi:hypothetical protein